MTEEMVKRGEYGLPMACLWMWVYYLTMEGCECTWVQDFVNEYIESAKFLIKLGEQVNGDNVVTTHSFHRIDCKLATNSFQTVIRRI